MIIYEKGYRYINLFITVNEIKLIYAALQTNDGTFEIGQIGYEGADNYSVNKIEAFGHSFIKVTGAVGANAPIANYVSLTFPPTSIHIEAHTIEADVDQDGINEIVATVGTAAETTIYRMKNDSLVSANLNEIMKANVVIYDPQANIFQVE